MRVKITHSIDLEEVPTKASELIIPAEDNLSNALRWLKTLGQDLSNNNIPAEMASLSLDRIRRAMGSADTVLAEVENIMRSMVEHEREQELLPSPPPAPQTKLHHPDDFDRMMEEVAEEKEEKELLVKDMLRGIEEKQNESDHPF